MRLYHGIYNKLSDLTVLLAEAMGYKAVAVSDEHGTSYIVLPGAIK